MRFMIITSCMTYLIMGLTVLTGCKSQSSGVIYDSPSLKIDQLTDNTFIHVSYLETESFGKVPCNGMIIVDGGEAIIFDTPTDDPTSEELINWVEDELESKVIGVVVTHFHIDCLGGLRSFHSRQIPSYANQKTIELAMENNEVVPINGFEDELELTIGDKKVINDFVGEGHTTDNIIGYFPHDKVIFGGCLIKSIGAGKGNLADANVTDWSSTVDKLKNKYLSTEIVIPGHGTHGGVDLLEYTIEKFKNE